MAKMKITEYRGYVIEYHPLFKVVIMKDGTSKSCRSVKDAKTFVDLLIEYNDEYYFCSSKNILKFYPNEELVSYMQEFTADPEKLKRIVQSKDTF